MKNRLKEKQSKLILEELEARLLFSGGVEGLIDNHVASATAVTQLNIDDNADLQTDSDTTTTAEQQRHEILFVDTDVDNYQTLIDDITGQSDDNRHIEVVVLDNNQNGIEQISTTLKHFDDLDAVHIIAHGSDGSVDLGNTTLNADTLNQNQLSIALWANAFDEAGDILIYG
ncbi:MAG: DUF4347 domain-containing protein, partial [Planctomycetaceae bacterium]|nr:DUF4347 domain-containing protein [Planctomycetaceae bacterium]